MRRILGVSIALGCVASSGCVAQLQPDQSVAPSVQAGSTVRYVALGDSYTIGTGVAASERWPDQLVEKLGDRVPLELVANLGVNGYTSGDLIADELPELADLRPDLVTMLIGVNDVVRDVPVDRYQANVDQILGALLQLVPRERIVIVSTPDYTRTPRGADFGNPDEQRAGIQTVNSIMAQAARDRGIAFVDIGPEADLAGEDATLVAGDQLHPSGTQYARWVELITPVVAELFSR